MRKTLQRRLARLESRAGIDVGPLEVFIRLLVGPDDPKPWEPTRAEACGRIWLREPGETVEDFKSRVMAIARNHDPLLKSRILFDYAKEDDPNFNPRISSSEPDA